MSVDQRYVDLDITLDPLEVLRLMGGSRCIPVRQSVLRLVERFVAESWGKIHACGVYTVREVQIRTTDHLHLEGCQPFEGQIAGFMEPARRVAVFVATIGDEIEQMAERRMEQGATLEGYTLDAIGSAAADAASDAMADHVLWNDAGPDEGVTAPFSPGYCGLGLEQQKTLFSIVDATPLSVELLPTMIMRPVKSVSGLVGIGPQAELTAHGIPCDSCRAPSCKMRRRIGTSH